MTDKQIIIDNIDVSGCRYYDDRYGYCDACKDDIDGASFTKCLEYNDCHYKRMMHTGAELNIHKNDKEHAYKRIAELQAELKRKEQEVDVLKAENDELKNFHINLVGVKECEIRELLKLKQTLAEIKEIANKFDYWNSNLSQTSEILHEIIEKISEVEDVS